MGQIQIVIYGFLAMGFTMSLVYITVENLNAAKRYRRHD